MFLQILVALAVCAACILGNSHHGNLNFDDLNVPLNNELSYRLAKAAMNSHHKSFEKHSKKSAAKFSEMAASAKLAKGHHVEKKQLSTGSSGILKTLTKINSDCSGSATTAMYRVVSDECLSFPTADTPYSMRLVCTANGDQGYRTYLGVNCPVEGMLSEEIQQQAVKCNLDEESYNDEGAFQMTSTHCDIGASPSYAPGMLQKIYSTSDCSGSEWMAYNSHFDVCTFNLDEDGSYYYTKMLGCTANGETKMVMFSDANCFHPVAKGVMAMEDVNECVSSGDNYVKLTCHMP